MSAGIPNITASGLLPPMLAMDLDFNTIVFLVVIVVSLLSRVFGKKEPEHGEDWTEGEEWEQEPTVRQNDSGPTQNWEEQMRRLLGGETPVQAQPSQLDSSPFVAPQPPPLKTPPALPADPSPSFTPSDAYSFDLATALGNSPPTVKHHHRSLAATKAIKLLRDPDSTRQAIITAVILAPPKALS